jgi:hypothetical protein
VPPPAAGRGSAELFAQSHTLWQRNRQDWQQRAEEAGAPGRGGGSELPPQLQAQLSALQAQQALLSQQLQLQTAATASAQAAAARAEAAAAAQAALAQRLAQSPSMLASSGARAVGGSSAAGSSLQLQPASRPGTGLAPLALPRRHPLAHPLLRMPGARPFAAPALGGAAAAMQSSVRGHLLPPRLLQQRAASLGAAGQPGLSLPLPPAGRPLPLPRGLPPRLVPLPRGAALLAASSAAPRPAAPLGRPLLAGLRPFLASRQGSTHPSL